MDMAGQIRNRINSFQIIIAGFALVILLGALLLMLPLSSADRTVTGFDDALFTSVSAVCVTGLVVRDTASYWSYFGQAVILTLIEIGGLGVIVVAVMFSKVSGRKISLLQRQTLQGAISAHQMGGLVNLTGFIVKTALLFEAAGALIMMPVMCGRYGADGIWMAVFHAVSAFCNAGFDLMGTRTGHYSSLTSFSSDPVICLTVSALIMVGGIGFLTWRDIAEHKWRIHLFRMQSKVILTMTFLLIALPAAFFFWGDFAELPLGERICASLFQAVTPRTAGFNTVEISEMSSAGRAMITGLMLVGGAPGSTAGGMKITTLAVLLGNVSSVFVQKENVRFFRRRVDDTAVKSAATIMTLYILLFGAGGFAISSLENITMEMCLFETASAIGTVGLSLGMTPTLGSMSRIILMSLMFLGRVGSLTFIMAAVSGRIAVPSQYPVEKIMVG